MKKIYTNEQKDEILKMYWSGESVASILASTGVAKSTLYKWIREAPPKKAKPVNMTDFRILKQRCETLANCFAIFAHVKRSARLLLREPKARFIGQSPASFFMRVSALHFQTKEHCSRSALLFGMC